MSGAWVVMGFLVAIVLIITVLVALVICLCRCWKKSVNPNPNPNPMDKPTESIKTESASNGSSDAVVHVSDAPIQARNPEVAVRATSMKLQIRKIPYKELREATNSFSEEAKIGHGGNGVVYRGKLENNLVAVKKLNQSFTVAEPQDGFIREVDNAGRLRHRNVVELIGYCFDRKGILIVFEYISNGTLTDHLFSSSSSSSSSSSTPPVTIRPLLSWENRQKIALGLAAGIDYLHNLCKQRMIHRDIKPGNVMLDADFTPKLGDFGCSRFTDHGQSLHTIAPGGTPYYYAPEMGNNGRKASAETDVFAFGLVLMHIATGKTIVLQDLNLPLLSWVWSLNDQSRLLEAVDPRLTLIYDDSDEAERMLKVGLACCNWAPVDRPTIKEAIQMLEGTKTPTQVKPLWGTYKKDLDSYQRRLSSSQGGTGQASSSKPAGSGPIQARSAEVAMRAASKKLHIREIPYEDLRKATDSFSELAKIGKGGYGAVYKGKLENQLVAVKRLNRPLRPKEPQDEFIREVDNAGRLRHRNVVELIGYCFDRKGLLIVFEYISNGTLTDHLSSSSSSSSAPPNRPLLSWENRQKIALGLAAGIDYLHNLCKQQMIHRDIKPSNVMLEADFTPKLGDFGCSRFTDHGHSLQSTGQAGTMGYIAPDITIYGQKASAETDVFSFGMVLLQIATGKKLLVEQVGLPLFSWVWSLNKKGRPLEAVDQRLRMYKSDEAVRMIRVGLACCNWSPNDRPTIKEVIQMLDGSNTLIQVKPIQGHYKEALVPSSSQGPQDTNS